MATTTNRGYPYPANTDAPAGPTQIQALATAVDADIDGGGWVNTSTNGVVVTAATGTTFGSAMIRRCGTSVSFVYQCTLTTAITVAANGNTPDTLIGTFVTAYTTTAPFVQIIGGNTPIVTGYVQTGNQIILAATSAGATLPVSTVITIGGTYFL